MFFKEYQFSYPETDIWPIKLRQIERMWAIKKLNKNIFISYQYF